MAYEKKGGGGKGSAPDSGTGKGSVRSVDYQESVQGSPKDSSPSGSGTSRVEGPNPGR